MKFIQQQLWPKWDFATSFVQMKMFRWSIMRCAFHPIIIEFDFISDQTKWIVRQRDNNSDDCAQLFMYTNKMYIGIRETVFVLKSV